VIGDDSGVVSVYEASKETFLLCFKTEKMPKEISFINLLDLSQIPNPNKEQIFFSFGTSIKAYNKKGSEFLSYSTNATEPIRGFAGDDSQLWIYGVILLFR